MNEPSSDKPKIIVDEDWKTRVQAEKESAKNQSDSPPEAQQEQASPEEFPIPEASFSVLVTTLASQAMMALGQAATPDDQEITVNFEFAKHCIDTLDVLEKKTEGNLTQEESGLLSRFSYELRMLFVAVQSNPPKKDPPTPA